MGLRQYHRWFLGLLALACCLPAAAQKNAAAKNWVLQPSFDGLLYSNWPTGNKPCCFQAAPTLISTDITSGSTTGGESNKGAYVSLFGYSFGRQADLGTAGGARVYFQNPDTSAWVEVANYRALNVARVFPRLQIERIIVQIGSLGAIANGKVMAVKVTVNGVDSNVLASWFTVQPGDFYFAANASHSDGTPTGNEGTGVKNDITHPYRYIQNYSGTTASGLWTTLQAGDTIVVRGGTWSDNQGFDSRWLRVWHTTGTAPNGTVANGYIHIVAYPGPILGNKQEDVHFIDIGGGGGGIEGCNSASAALGWGKYFSVSGLHLELNATSVSDAAPVNLQNGGDNWRVVDNELGPWASTTTSPTNAKCGGLCGQGAGTPGPYVAFNYVHDIDGDHAVQENHGIYIGDSGGSYNQTSANWEVAYNWVYNIASGSAFQWHDSAGSSLMTGMKVHHNYLDTAAKYGINADNSLQSGDVYDNVVVNMTRNGMRFGSDIASAAINVVHNTFRQLSSSSAYKQVISNETAGLTSGSIKVYQNIIQTTSGAGSGMAYYGFGAGDTAVTVSQNLYHDIAGSLTVPTKDATGVLGDPKFNNVAANDFTVQGGSPALAACTLAQPIAVATDFYGISRPVTGTGAPGGTKNDIGIGQGALQ